MHGSPPCTITVVRFAAWRAAVGVVAAASLAALVAWLVGSPLGASAWVRAGVAAGALGVAAIAVSLWRQPARRLRWDGVAWSLAAVDPPGPERSGTLEVAVDLGSFVLLRFRPQGGPRWASACWIPVGRAGLEPDWYAFRRALHSPPRQPQDEARSAPDLRSR